MNRQLPFLLLFLLPGIGAAQITSDVKDVQVAKQRLQIGTDNTKFFSSILQTISSAATHNQSPTAKAVYEYVQSAVGSGVSDGDKGDIVVTGGVWEIDQKSATEGQVLRWSGSEWLPNGLNLYDIVTTSQTVEEKYNQVWVDDIGASITLNLPACNAANDGVKIDIMKYGADTYGVVVEPSGSELFSDGEASKTIYSAGAGISCTCRKEVGHSGFWLFITL